MINDATQLELATFLQTKNDTDFVFSSDSLRYTLNAFSPGDPILSNFGYRIVLVDFSISVTIPTSWTQTEVEQSQQTFVTQTREFLEQFWSVNHVEMRSLIFTYSVFGEPCIPPNNNKKETVYFSFASALKVDAEALQAYEDPVVLFEALRQTFEDLDTVYLADYIRMTGGPFSETDQFLFGTSGSSLLDDCIVIC